MHAPLSFFDTTPVGRIVNRSNIFKPEMLLLICKANNRYSLLIRFTSDLDALDKSIPTQMADLIYCSAQIISVLVL